MQTSPDTSERLLSLKDAAIRLNLSLRAVYRLIAKGDLPRPVKVGGSSKFFISDLEKYFDSLKAKRKDSL